MKTKLIILVSCIFLFSCGKYEEGPKFSLKPKSKRLVGEWELDKIKGANISNDITFTSYEFEFEKDGDFSISYTATVNYYFGSGSPQTISYNGFGDWEWEDDKEEIEVSYNIDNFFVSEEYDIIKLSSKELILEDRFNNEWTFDKK